MSFSVPSGYVVFSGDGCKACETLKEKLKVKSIPYTEFNVYENDEALEFMLSRGLRGIPQLFINGVLPNKDAV